MVSRGPCAFADFACRCGVRFRRSADDLRRIGVKVWIFRGEILTRQEEAAKRAGAAAQQRPVNVRRHSEVGLIERIDSS